MEAPTKKRGGALTHSQGAHSALLVAMFLIVGLGVAYAANTYPPHYGAIKGGDYPGRTILSLRRGVDALLGRWLADEEDFGEPAD